MHALYAVVAILSAGAASAASWGFDDATITVQGKGAGVGGGLKEKYDKLIHYIYHALMDTHQTRLKITSFEARRF